MKNKFLMIGLVAAVMGVGTVASLATWQFANLSRSMMADVFDRQTSSPSYGDPWQEKYRLNSCDLFQEKTVFKTGKTSLERVRNLDCANLDKDLSKERDGSYYVQTSYTDAVFKFLGVFNAPDLKVLTPIFVHQGTYICDYVNHGFKTTYAVMPYGRLGMTTASDYLEPSEMIYKIGSTMTVIVEETSKETKIPHDMNVCPIVGTLEGPGVSAGEVRINWGFVSRKIMNMLIIQPDSISYVKNNEVVNDLPGGKYTLSFPEMYKEFKFQIQVPEKAKAAK